MPSAAPRTASCTEQTLSCTEQTASRTEPRERRTRPAPPAARDVVFCFSYLSWQAAADRGWFGTEDRLARGLLLHERVERLLVCDLLRSLPAKCGNEPLPITTRSA